MGTDGRVGSLLILSAAFLPTWSISRNLWSQTNTKKENYLTNSRRQKDVIAQNVTA